MRRKTIGWSRNGVHIREFLIWLGLRCKKKHTCFAWTLLLWASNFNIYDFIKKLLLCFETKSISFQLSYWKNFPYHKTYLSPFPVKKIQATKTSTLPENNNKLNDRFLKISQYSSSNIYTTGLQNALLIFNINIYGSFTWRANLSVCRIWCEHKVILKWCDNNIYDNLKGQCKTWNNNNNDDNNTMRIAYINCWDDDAPRSSTTTTPHTYVITIKCAI